MSRSNNHDNLQNPATRWFDWSGSEGKIKFYDKENKQNVFVDLPFSFLVLDILTTITGYSDSHQSGIWANEIRDVRSEKLTIRTKHGVLAEGLYADVKNTPGCKYTQSVYIAYKTPEGLRIGNLKLSGSAVGPWIEFRNAVKNAIYDGAVAITGSTDEKKGATKYKSPIFTTKQTSAESDEAAKELDMQLQAYLEAYFDKREEYVPADVVHDEVQINENAFVASASKAITSAVNGTRVQEPDMNWGTPSDSEVPEDDGMPF